MNLSSKQYEALLDEVQGYVTGINPLTMKSAVTLVLGDYLRAIGGVALTAVLEPVEEPRPVLHVSAPYAGTVAAIFEVALNGAVVNPQAYRTTYLDSGCVDVFMPSDTGKSLVAVKYAWRPTMATKEMPPDWYRQHAPALCAGVLATLLTQQGKPWADPVIGAQFNLRYQDMMHEALYRLHASRMEGGRFDMRDRNEPFVPGFGFGGF